MTFRRRSASVLWAILLAASCVGAPGPEEVSAADYGPAPHPERAVQRTKAALIESVMFSSTGRRFRSWGPLRGWVKVGDFTEPRFGWIVKVSAWFTNLVGGAGVQGAYCLFQEDTLVRTWEGDEGNVEWGFLYEPIP